MEPPPRHRCQHFLRTRFYCSLLRLHRSFQVSIGLDEASFSSRCIHTRYTHACGVRVVILELGGGALGIFKSQIEPHAINRRPLSPSHYILSVPCGASVASDEYRPWSEAPCIPYHNVWYLYTMVFRDVPDYDRLLTYYRAMRHRRIARPSPHVHGDGCGLLPTQHPRPRSDQL